jgi:hypothetical protein
VRHHPSVLQLLHHVTPPSATLRRERHIADAVEAAQPHRQMPPIRRGDLPPLQLSRLGVDIVEGELLSVDVQSAYDRHWDLLMLRDLMSNAHEANASRAPELRRPPNVLSVKSRRHGQQPGQLNRLQDRADACHLWQC